VFTKTCNFVIGATTTTDMPTINLPEVAFIGRSNVGKSSMINALTGRKNLARVSNTPGRTQQINFFEIDHKLRLVDLPGYGYAKASKEQIIACNILINEYLKNRTMLRLAYMIIDSRRGIKDIDIDMMIILNEAMVTYQVILTKVDKIKLSYLERIIEETALTIGGYSTTCQEILATSIKNGFGIAALRKNILSI
jgi:GTP-binding protein